MMQKSLSELFLSIKKEVVEAVTDLEYGGITVNEIGLLSPLAYLGGNEEGIVSENDVEYTMKLITPRGHCRKTKHCKGKTAQLFSLYLINHSMILSGFYLN